MASVGTDVSSCREYGSDRGTEQAGARCRWFCPVYGADRVWSDKSCLRRELSCLRCRRTSRGRCRGRRGVFARGLTWFRAPARRKRSSRRPCFHDQLLPLEGGGLAAMAARGQGSAYFSGLCRIAERPHDKAQFHARGSFMLLHADHRSQIGEDRWMGDGDASPQRAKARYGSGGAEIDTEPCSWHRHFDGGSRERGRHVGSGIRCFVPRVRHNLGGFDGR